MRRAYVIQALVGEVEPSALNIYEGLHTTGRFSPGSASACPARCSYSKLQVAPDERAEQAEEADEVALARPIGTDEDVDRPEA